MEYHCRCIGVGGQFVDNIFSSKFDVVNLAELLKKERKIMLKTLRKIRRGAWNFQRILGTLTMLMEFLIGQWKRGSKKLTNKFIGRNIVRRLFLK
jgi:hypothetical protein